MSKMPPVPPDQRSDKGAGRNPQPSPDSSRKKGPHENLEEQGRQGNIHQNTHNQGYQQDR